MQILLLGAPGAGKGTQAKLISRKYGIPHVATGDMLRAAISAKTELGKAVQRSMKEGQLIADDIMVGLVQGRLEEEDCRTGFILDGFPRTLPQAQALTKTGVFLDFVIEIRVIDEEIVRRLSGRRIHPKSGRIYHIEHNSPQRPGLDDITGEGLIQREDDQEETIRRRLKVYHSRTEPLISYYQDFALNHPQYKIPHYIYESGRGDIAAVSQDIFRCLDSQ